MFNTSLNNGSNEKTGAIKAWGGSAAPFGWLICDGSAISRTLYAALFDVIGETYGAGDGSTTFNLPNGSNIVNSIDSNVPCKGNGKAIGITNGGANYGVIGTQYTNSYPLYQGRSAGAFGANVGQGGFGLGDNLGYGTALGITADANKSGIIGTATSSYLACKLIIKY